VGAGAGWGGRRAADGLQDEGLDARFLHLDVTDEKTIQQAVVHMAEEFGRLDVLVNNAGITVEEERPRPDRPSTAVRPSDITADHMRSTYEVNVFGVVAVTHAMLPLLRRSNAARIVNMSSPLGSLTLRANPQHLVARVGLLAYNSSKAALNAITLQYANELRGTGILVNAANPGFVATDLNSHMGERSVSDGARIAVHLATLPEGDQCTGAFLGDEGPVPW
jgi:NAD(P)-dependent dehydrogenase (short-subunit alcohol dehydrogenase family)